MGEGEDNEKAIEFMNFQGKNHHSECPENDIINNFE
jgi:hypothetical protein